jgi:2-polyprenyl-3-methyl-5-hydroxy-6-metoxy-1,4-benzoquinol methylase
VLEFGCGIGVFLPTLCEQCGEVFAIDLFPQYAKNLCKDLNLTVTFIENISDLPDEKLDLITAADVMEHLEDPLAYINIFKKKLKNGGKLIVSGPTESSVYKIGRTVAGFRKFGDYHHTNINDLKKIIRQNGFDLIKTISLPFVFPPYLFKVCEFIKS